jgi:hypothetical protein
MLQQLADGLPALEMASYSNHSQQQHQNAPLHLAAANKLKQDTCCYKLLQQLLQQQSSNSTWIGCDSHMEFHTIHIIIKPLTCPSSCGWLLPQPSSCRSHWPQQLPQHTCGQTWQQSRCLLHCTWSRSQLHHQPEQYGPCSGEDEGALGWGVPPPCCTKKQSHDMVMTSLHTVSSADAASHVQPGYQHGQQDPNHQQTHHWK